MMNHHALNVSRPVLSISLLTNGQKKELTKCLNSLLHLRKAIPSELVIVDTGCDSETVRLLEQHTDKIIKYTWKNDFSDARNTQLSACSGKWFLFLDDDEWFEDTTEIEDFFASGAYEGYDFANYIQRNYHDNSSIRFSDDYVTRMARISGILHFESCIHEYMVSDSIRVYSLNSYVHHYGYVYNSDAEKYRHFERNLSLLQKMLQKEPDNIRWHIHIVQEYWAVCEYNTLIDFSLSSLSRFAGKTDTQLLATLGTLYMSIAESFFNTYNYKAALEAATNALSDKRLLPLARASMNELVVRCYAMLSDYDALVPYATEYFDYFEKYHADKEVLSTQSGFLLDETFTRQYFEEVCWIMVQKALQDKDITLLKEYFDKIDFSSEILFTFNPDTIEDIVRFMADAEYDDWFVGAVERLLPRGDHTEKIIAIIQEAELRADESGDSSTNNGSSFTKLCRIFTQVSFAHPYIAYLKILSCGVEGAIPPADEDSLGSPATPENLQYLFEYICAFDNSFLLYKEAFWNILLDNNIDISTAFSNIPFDRWKTIVENLCTR